LDVLMLVIGTAVVPVFDSVTTTVVDEVAPRPVGGNVSPPHVMTNGDDVTVDEVAGVLLEQLAENTTRRANTARST